MRSIPNFKKRKLYHQIHPIGLGTDIASATAFLFLRFPSCRIPEI